MGKKKIRPKLEYATIVYGIFSFSLSVGEKKGSLSLAFSPLVAGQGVYALFKSV